ncbi:3194_t:CDS:2 [Acaulospora colombiana]|uniref:3194_t:CDS:1 n=1 Tax=Acaulospora colombiana TaxID=27376 RepID=A0ACA9KSX5_9GLOM|nr:3194_t:CDS:2 [Acaulospora colombiana]
MLHRKNWKYVNGQIKNSLGARSAYLGNTEFHRTRRTAGLGHANSLINLIGLAS